MELDQKSSNKAEIPAGWVELEVKNSVINISITDRKIPQKFYLESGNFPVIDQGQNHIGGYTNDESMLVDCELPVIVFGDHTKTVKHANQRFATGADGVKVLKPLPFLEQEFAFYSLTNAAKRLKTKGYARHFQEFSKLKIKIPPLPEQVRIVAKLDELFSELDKGVENLRAAQQQLKVYRQALLKHAFEGKLTAEWRAQNPDKMESAEALLARIQQEREARYQQQLAEWQEAQQAWEANGKTGSKPAKPKVPKALPALTAEELAELPELPVGWCWVQLEALITGIDQGWSPKCENQPTEDESWGVIKTTAIQHGQFLESYNKSLPKNLEPRIQHKLSIGDILITRAGPRVRVGVCCLIKKVSKNLMNCDKAYRVRSLDSVCAPSYLEGVLNSPKILDTLEHIKSGINDSGVNLNQGAFLRLAIPLCSLSEQTALLIELEEKISNLDQLENTIATSLQQAEALRQSILKKAFSGQLVPQHPDDEPASVLLERIRAERAAQQPATKRGRKVAKPA